MEKSSWGELAIRTLGRKSVGHPLTVMRVFEATAPSGCFQALESVPSSPESDTPRSARPIARARTHLLFYGQERNGR